jgi:hypothetical protein
MPSDTFWSNTTRIPNPQPSDTLIPVIQRPYTESSANPETSYYADPETVGPGLDIRLLDPAQRHIPGSAKGAVPLDYIEAARIVYPIYDGVNNVLSKDRPAELDGVDAPAAVDLATFAGWHSSFQAEYLARLGTSLVFPPGAPLNTAQAIYRLGSDSIVHNLVSMTLSDYAKLPKADKLSFQADLINSGVAGRLGLSSSAQALHAALDTVIADINSPGGLRQRDKNVFIDQLELIRIGLPPTDGAGTVLANEPTLFSFDAVNSAIGKITERFLRAEDFGTARDSLFFPGDIPTGPRYFGKTASYSSEVRGESPTTVERGMDEFMRAERAILTAQNRRTGIVGATFGVDPKLDVPNLIYQLQLTYETQSEGLADSGTELIRQLHKLLQDYGVMQKLVNDQIKKYNPDEADDRLAFTALTSFNDSERAVLSMFALDAAAIPATAHPIETRFEIPRPRQLFYTYVPAAGSTPGRTIPVEQRKTFWDQFSTQLADTVTLLNQRNQLLQNEIENATKQQNRHFELGNNALRKMNDMIMTIGRM